MGLLDNPGDILGATALSAGSQQAQMAIQNRMADLAAKREAMTEGISKLMTTGYSMRDAYNYLRQTNPQWGLPDVGENLSAEQPFRYLAQMYSGLYRGYAGAQANANARLADTQANDATRLALGDEADQTRRYGIDTSAATGRYRADQGLAASQYRTDEMGQAATDRNQLGYDTLDWRANNADAVNQLTQERLANQYELGRRALSEKEDYQQALVHLATAKEGSLEYNRALDYGLRQYGVSARVMLDQAEAAKASGQLGALGSGYTKNGLTPWEEDEYKQSLAQKNFLFDEAQKAPLMTERSRAQEQLKALQAKIDNFVRVGNGRRAAGWTTQAPGTTILSPEAGARQYMQGAPGLGASVPPVPPGVGAGSGFTPDDGSTISVGGKWYIYRNGTLVPAAETPGAPPPATPGSFAPPGVPGNPGPPGQGVKGPARAFAGYLSHAAHVPGGFTPLPPAPVSPIPTDRKGRPLSPFRGAWGGGGR